MRRGDKVRCVDAKERGIPLREGHIYTVKRSVSARDVEERTGEAIILERAHIPGVTLEEVEGYFMQTRFEVVSQPTPE